MPSGLEMIPAGALVGGAEVGAPVGESDGGGTGWGGDGHAEPRRVPTVAREAHCVAFVSRVNPAGMSPHKPVLLHKYIWVRRLSAPSSDGREPVSWLK